LQTAFLRDTRTMFPSSSITIMNFESHHHDVDDSRRLLVERALFLLPESVNEAYILASVHVPSLLASETDPLVFFRHENNVNEAALKLCSYWSKRITCYGERAFLPMNLTGAGTLSDQDIEAMRHGCTRILPHDNHGRGVFLIDSSMIASCLSSTGARSLFFQLHHLARQSLPLPSKGIVIILVLRGMPNLAHVESVFNILAELLHEAIPSTVCCVHILAPNSTTSPSAIGYIMRLCMSRLLTDHIVVTDIDLPKEVVLRKLESCGLSRQDLPQGLVGGSYDGWLCNAMSTLDASFFAPAAPAPDRRQEPQVHSRDFPFSHKLLLSQEMNTLPENSFRFATHADLASVYARPRLCFDSSRIRQIDEPVLKQKAIDASQQDAGVHSQENRKRPPISSRTTEDPLHHYAEALAAFAASPAAPDASMPSCPPVGENEASKVPATAQKMGTSTRVQQVPPRQEQETEEEFFRRRNRAYSKRKYERKKIEIQVLHDENQRLSDENGHLRREQELLESLLVQARACLQARRA
jgi:hypothetical protein